MSAATRSGARLRSHRHGFTFRLAAITPADLAQKKCAVCRRPIHDDAAYIKTEELILYCSKRCKGTAYARRKGIPVGRSTRWRGVYEARLSADVDVVTEIRVRRTA